MFGCIQTITIWNYYRQTVQPYNDVFNRHVINGVKWDSLSQIDLVERGVNADNASEVMIPDNPENSKYKNELEWSMLGDDEKALYFTLKENDIIALGDCPEEIPPYTEPEILDKYDKYAFNIKRVEEYNQPFKLPQSRYVKVLSV